MLKAYSQGPTKLTFADGEIIYARRITVLEDQDLIAFDLVKSNRAKPHYEGVEYPPGITARISDIITCEPAPD